MSGTSIGKGGRVHFALVCASRSCPDLRHEPYNAGQLDEQLDEQVADFIDSPGKGLRVTSSTLRVSRIFDWSLNGPPASPGTGGRR